MPLNTLRLNQRQLHPNDRITFIKPLPGPTSSIADIILKKIAAICYPIMKAHSLSITTLEEFPPNREFMGRNFNGGEVIQLVLRRMPSRSSTTATNGTITSLDHHSSTFVSETEHAGWLSLRSIEMVMMHELAHCIHMNHSKSFWTVRDDYASHLRVLWSRGYTGEGMWGRGQSLISGDFTSSAPGADDFADLCGGAYRGRRRKRRPKQTYAERKKRRLERTERKFGAGREMDADEAEAERVLLEGRPVAGKPRVAGSKRGRELRAAAALMRFEKAKVEERKREETKVESDEEEETETASEEDEEEGEELRDEKGERVVDAHGNGLRRVCGDDEGGAEQAHEMEELRGLADEVNEIASSTDDDADSKEPVLPRKGNDEPELSREEPAKPKQEEKQAASSIACPMCTLVNSAGSTVCEACGHALSGGWTCDAEACTAAGYVNAATAERCGLCGRLRQAPA